MIKQIYALKSNMEQAFVAGRRVAVTTFTVPEHTLISAAVDSGKALIGIGKRKPTTRKSIQGILKKFKLDFTPRYFREVSPEDSSTPTDVNVAIDLATLLTEGKQVQISAVSKGKGFSGVIKRWGFHTQPRTHGQSDRHRAPGSIGRGTTPGRVLAGKHMAGRMGNDLKTVKKLTILSFDPATRTLKVRGTTPGFKTSLTKITFLS